MDGCAACCCYFWSPVCVCLLLHVWATDRPTDRPTDQPDANSSHDLTKLWTDAQQIPKIFPFLLRRGQSFAPRLPQFPRPADEDIGVCKRACMRACVRA